MGFVTSGGSDRVVTLESDSEGGVYIKVGDTYVLGISEDGSLHLIDFVDAEEVGNLKLTDGKDDGWGGSNRRARVFFDGEELTLPSEQKKVEKKATKRTKKSSTVSF